MRVKYVPGLKPWLVDLGDGCFTFFEGVSPPTPEWLKSIEPLVKFHKEVILPMVIAEYNKEPLDAVPS
jgi:hypothetical protein